MKLGSLLLAAGALALSACAMAPARTAASDAALQDAASLMVSIVQHGEGADFPDLESQLNDQAAAAPSDPFVLMLTAQARRSLSDYSQDRAERVRLRHKALADYDRAIALAKPSDSPRTVMLSGQESEVDLKDLAQLRADLFHQVQTDR
jgi:hypothetical protein